MEKRDYAISLRKSKDLSQNDVVKLLEKREVFITKQTISNFENGKFTSEKTLKSLANIYNVTIDQLLS